METSSARAALEGVRVVDLGSGHAAAVAALTLAECGAEVVKARAADSILSAVQAAIWERSKSPLALDARVPVQRAELDVWLQRADIVIHDLTPERAGELGLDDASLAQQHPGLIAVSITAWPAGHPEAELPVSDVLALAQLGILDEQASEVRAGPVYLRFPLGSWHASALAVAGALARLYVRRGGPVRTSLVQGALIPMFMHWARAETPTPAALGMPKNNPVTLFECADGRWVHVMGQPAKAPWIAEGLAAMSAGERARHNQRYASAPVQYMPDWGAVAAVFATRSSGAWLEHLWQHDIPLQLVQPPGLLYDDEQARANGYVVEVQTQAFGKTLQPGVPLHVDPPPRLRPAPAAPQWTARERACAVPSAAHPLAGLKVLDFGCYLAGPLAAMVLADMGAEVIKIEPATGDPLRPAEWAFNGCQRGKRTIALQLKDPATRPIVERLVREADVVHHNLRLPAAQKLGIGYDSLAAINPRLIYCHLSSYGVRGPRKDWPGYDQLFQAASGWELAGAGEGNPPIWHRFGMMDHLAGLHSLNATLMGLLQRAHDGRGRFVAASLLGAALFTSDSALDAQGELLPCDRLDAQLMGVSPSRRLYRCSDGWVALDGRADDAPQQLLRAAGADVEAAFAQGSVGQALRIAAEAGIAAVRVTLDGRSAFFDSPDNARLNLSVAYAHPRYGRFEQPGPSVDFGCGVAPGTLRAPPLLGQHSREILAELGYTDTESARLIERGCVPAA